MKTMYGRELKFIARQTNKYWLPNLWRSRQRRHTINVSIPEALGWLLNSVTSENVFIFNHAHFFSEKKYGSDRLGLFILLTCLHYQVSWIFNQVPCVSSCWGEKTHTRGLQRKWGTPYQPLSQSTGRNFFKSCHIYVLFTPLDAGNVKHMIQTLAFYSLRNPWKLTTATHLPTGQFQSAAI